jgi:hypothetical protein
LRSNKSPITGIEEAWAEEIYENVPPPEISQWTDPRYSYRGVEDAVNEPIRAEGIPVAMPPSAVLEDGPL